MPGRSKRLTCTASGSSGDSPTWKAASKFCVFSQCRPTVAGSVCRSTTVTPVELRPDMIERLITR